MSDPAPKAPTGNVIQETPLSESQPPQPPGGLIFTEPEPIGPVRTTEDQGAPADDSQPDSTSKLVLKNRWQLMQFLVTTTGPAVFAGVLFMLVGTTVARYAFLPRIYTCPGGATCPHSFDPRGDVLRILQTAMMYWLQSGCFIAGVGLVKVVAYHAWFTLMTRPDNTIKRLELDLAIINGRAFQTAVLLRARPRMFMILFTLLLTAITFLVELIVNRSIATLETAAHPRVTFTYPERFTLSGVGLSGDIYSSMTFQTKVQEASYEWLLADNQTHPFDRFSNTFVVRDNRTTSASLAVPSGSRVIGTVSCSPANISSTISPPDPDLGTITLYNITYGDQWLSHLSSVFLGPALLREPYFIGNHSVALHFLWLSNQPGVLENTTVTSDGKVYITACTHTIELLPIPILDEHSDVIKPTQLYIPPESRKGSDPVCATGADDAACMALIVAHSLTYQWSFFTSTLVSSGEISAIYMFCSRGGFSTYGSDSDRSCYVDAQAWTVTLAAFTNGLLQTSQLSGNVTQELHVDAITVNRHRWWLQGIIPAAMFALWLMSVGYVAYRNPGRWEDPKELDLAEVLDVATESRDQIRIESLHSAKVGGTVRHSSSVG